MNSPEPTSKHLDTRQHILVTGKSVILGKGFTAVGLNELLTRAGVPKGSFYHYFKSKEQFGVALLADYFETYLERLDKTLSPERGAAASLHAYFQNWLDSQCSDITEDKCLVVKLSAEVTDLSEAMRITLQEGTQRVISRLAECLQAGMAAGEFAAVLDAQQSARELYYMWIGATLLTKVERTRAALECAMAATVTRLQIQPVEA
ncbi:TetR/AcrR family transcriptional regulator [Methylobacillus flagellatus]|uniref:TetR/AcrR family transcriptional regulator n=1 Tax=Methylobacillus flagellatus TaxID=405 RepID=UPI0010F51998|nr:TetR/AcrR family transcriptional regulator [Methylobacillus flagellatus]